MNTETAKKNRGKIIVGVTAVLSLLALVSVSIWLILTPMPAPDAGDIDTSAEASEEAAAEDVDEEGEQELPETVLDDQGLAVMVVTTDPRTAAASAAAVLWTVDTTRYDYAEDFRRYAITRVMRPSPEYVGADDQIETTVDREKSSLGGVVMMQGDLVEATIEGVQRETYDPEGGWWWALGDDRNFSAYQARSASIVSQPIEVLDAEQMQAVDPSVKTQIQDNWTVEKPGASMHRFWVRVETVTTTGDGSKKLRNPAAMVVYCDPPADGGLCGVAVLTRNYPASWQRPL